MTAPSNEDTIINYRTKKTLKDAFFSLCKDQNVTATARLNDFMRHCLSESGWIHPATPAKTKKTQPVSDWREELIRS